HVRIARYNIAANDNAFAVDHTDMRGLVTHIHSCKNRHRSPSSFGAPNGDSVPRRRVATSITRCHRNRRLRPKAGRAGALAAAARSGAGWAGSEALRAM